MILTQYYEQRGQLIAEARQLLDGITDATPEADAKQAEERSDALMAQVDALDAKIKREERMTQAETAEEERRSRQRPNRDGRAPAVDDDTSETRSDEQVQTEYRDAFMAAVRAGGDLSALDAETRDLLRQGYVETRTQTVGTNAAGGFTVPRSLASSIVEVMKDWGPMYDPGVTDEMVTSSGNPFDIPTNDDTGNSAAALAEAANLTDDGSGDLVFGQKQLEAYVSATPWLQISFELLQDTQFNLEQFIARKLGERLGRRANSQLTVGTGVSQPNGVAVAAALGLTSASNAALIGDELITFQHTVNAAYRRSPKCFWMFADTTLAAIRKLKDGQGNYLWQMGDVRVGAPDLILGKGYVVNDDVAAIGANARSILFGDFSRYTVRKVGSPLIGTVRERFWPKVGMAGIIRFDGELVDAGAIKALRQAA